MTVVADAANPRNVPNIHENVNKYCKSRRFEEIEELNSYMYKKNNKSQSRHYRVCFQVLNASSDARIWSLFLPQRIMGLIVNIL